MKVTAKDKVEALLFSAVLIVGLLATMLISHRLVG